MHLRPAKYTDKPLEVSGDGVQVGFGARNGVNIITVPNSILAEGNNNTQQFTVKPTNYTKSAPNTPNKINIKLGNKDKNNGQNYSRFRYYSDYPDGYSYCFDGSKRFLSFEYLPATFTTTTDTSYTNSKVTITSTTTANFVKLDKTKQMELSIINLVELSTFAAGEGKFDLALDRAKEALKSFNSLNVFMMQQKRSNQHNNDILSNSHKNNDKVQPPMTTGVKLFELAIMVNSNLAGQLKNNAHLEESLELYTQLCKIATGNSSTKSTITLGNRIISQPSSQHQYDAKFFLYRFGINIGNILYEMNEFQKSLKYYRLTLDRLSSCGQDNLRIKLMNNISITILTMKGKADLDAITSLNLLLADNLSTQSQQASGGQNDQAQQQQQPMQQQLVTGKVGSEVCNSNHHKFGLYLIVCHFQRADLTSIMNTLRSLAKVDICRHYKRVFQLDDFNMKCIKNDGRRQQQASTNTVLNNGGRSNSSSVTFLSAVTDTGSSSHVTSTDWSQLQQQQIASHNRNRPFMEKVNRGKDKNRAEIIVRQQGIISPSDQQMPLIGAIFDQESNSIDCASSSDQPSGIDNITSFEGTTPNATVTNSTITTNFSTSTSTIGLEFKPTTTKQGSPTFVKLATSLLSSADSLLTKLSVFEKVRQVMSSVQQDRLEMLIGEKHNQVSDSLMMACNLLLEFDHLDTNRTIRKSVSNGSTETSSSPSSLYEFCNELLNSNEIYKSLVCDLKTNSISEMLKKNKYKLDEAIFLLKDVGNNLSNTKTNDDHTSTASVTSVSTGIQSKGENKSVAAARTNSIKMKNDNDGNVVLKSSMLATNSSLLYLLQNKPREALEKAELAVKLDNSNINALINLANSYYYLNNLTLAESLYQQASSLSDLHSTSWEVSYNLALVGRRLGHHSDELEDFIKSVLSHNKLDFASLTSQTMTIPKIQMVLIYQQFGDYSQAITILDDLIKNSRQSPEVCLLFSKLLEEHDRSSNAKTSSIPVLQQANRENPYHLPILERLIALNIKNFDYETAEDLLRNCIRNRPHQVRWYQMLAECQRRATDYNKSIVTYKMAIDMFPRDYGCLKALIKLTGELGLIEENKFYTARLSRTASQADSQDIR